MSSGFQAYLLDLRRFLKRLIQTSLNLEARRSRVNMANQRQYKHRRKWTDQMNDDLLNCKCKAVAMTQMEQPPLDGNRKKKGDIKLMKELWDAKGYNDFSFSSQNLRDQAARLEKSLGQQSSENVSPDSILRFYSTILRDSQTGESSNGLDMSSTDTVLINESRYQNQMNESQTTICPRFV